MSLLISCILQIIKVIYYWPGQRVELPCILCHRTGVFNGQIKHWAHLSGHWLSERFSEGLEVCSFYISR